MRQSRRTAWIGRVFLLALPVVVHCLALTQPALSQASRSKAATARKPPPPQVHYGADGLPGPVRELREALLAAVQSGQIEELRHLHDGSDLKPDLGPGLGKASPGDPIALWKGVSADGEGREVLAALSLVLEAGYVVLPLGKDLENNRLYIWPYFAEIPLDKLSPGQEVELLRLVPVATAKEMKAKGKYMHWRVAIGADGSWHTFRKDD